MGDNRECGWWRVFADSVCGCSGVWVKAEFIVQCDSEVFEAVDLLDCLIVDGNGVQESAVRVGVRIATSFVLLMFRCR